QAQQGGLAPAVAAHQAQLPVGVQLEVQVLKYRGIGPLVGKIQMLYGDLCHRHALLWSFSARFQAKNCRENGASQFSRRTFAPLSRALHVEYGARPQAESAAPSRSGMTVRRPFQALLCSATPSASGVAHLPASVSVDSADRIPQALFPVKGVRSPNCNP